MNGPAAVDQVDISTAARPYVGSQAEPRLPRLSLRLEQGPTALSRVFGLLCTLQLVPVTATSVLADPDAIRLDLAFAPDDRDRLDRLQRKLAQLVECLELEPLPTRA